MNLRENELSKLKQALTALDSSTEKLKTSYDSLKEEAARLNLDLEENRNFLRDILNSLNCGVVVTGIDGKIRLANPEAARLGADDPALVAKWKNGYANGAATQKTGFETEDGKILSISASSLRNERGERTGLIFIIEDETELDRLRKQARRSDRLAAVGKMAADMAHEIRNPLGGMELFASLLRRELEGDDDNLRLLSHVTTGIQSINNVISNMLLFTTEPAPVTERFDIKELISDLADFVKYILKQNDITASLSLPDGPLPLRADRNLVRQVILNLIHNAVSSMPDGGRMEIEARRAQSASGKRSVEIVVSDTGPGVEKAIREKIFDPFFTTREAGFGLGLSIASQIARAHGGYVDLIEAASGGAKFIVSLPQED